MSRDECAQTPDLRDRELVTNDKRFDFIEKLSFFPARAIAAARHDLRAAISTIYLDINTDICNHSCTFCDGFYRSLEAQAFTWPRLSRLVDEMTQLHVLAVVIAGDRGEPLLHPQFGQLLEKLIAARIRVGIYTNGTFVRSEWLPLMSGVSFMRISADAASAATHRRMHVYPAARDDFSLLQRNAGRLARVVGSLGVSFLIHPDNVDEIEAAADLFLNLGADFLELKPYYLPNYGVDSAWWQSTGPRIAAAVARVRALWGPRVVVNNQIDHLLAGGGTPALTVPHRLCRTSLLRLVVSTHGCYSCTPYRGEAERRVGDILTQSLQEVVESAAREALVERPCDRLCAYHAQNEFLLDLEARSRTVPPARRATTDQDFFI
jgi:MoaA/NifB/PqqE/SkfB family radical SAM enzyme